MAKHGRGLICLAMMPDRLDQLEIPLERSDNPSRATPPSACRSTRKDGTSTGISAADRAHTVHVANLAGVEASRSRSAGDVFPLRARSGGVLVRSGHTERPSISPALGTRISRCHLRDHDDDGTLARVRADEVCPQAWSADDHDRGPASSTGCEPNAS
jgi:3,4-dihydroxy 2-butanone 4-phosphate synthase/GTP cyclohydrolase II